jgi:hypothetical protein
VPAAGYNKCGQSTCQGFRVRFTASQRQPRHQQQMDTWQTTVAAGLRPPAAATSSIAESNCLSCTYLSCLLT